MEDKRILLSLSPDAVELLAELEQMSAGASRAEIVERALVALKERNEAPLKSDDERRGILGEPESDYEPE